LPDALVSAISAVGYETPSPIQAQCIPLLLSGRDLIGQAQTGTGKTAAFALPMLARMDCNLHAPQVLVLTPTRELALQVAEAFQSYATGLKGFQVLPLYGGQPYTAQFRQLQRGPQLVVGTPGRVMDHLRRGTLKLDQLRALVLDEADEMLRMGFIDAVEWVLEQTPPDRQLALFSATMPAPIRKVAEKHLRDPAHISIAAKTRTADNIRQRYWLVSGTHKLDALTRMLEFEATDGMIIFVRTRTSTVELADKLTARGFACEALNGDVPQAQREKAVERLKRGQLDILVATDVAARGLDVDRISHVINYDMPHDTEAYVHRIGRTGRAGRQGDAILFVAPRERRMLKMIEQATRQTIEPMHLPSAGDINTRRVERFKNRVREVLAGELDSYRDIIVALQAETDADPLDIAAALALMAQGDQPLLLDLKDVPVRREPRDYKEQRETRGYREQGEPYRPQSRPPVLREDGAEPPRAPRKRPPAADGDGPRPLRGHPDVAMERFRLAVGRNHGVQPGHIVGAIANEADIDSAFIGHIALYDDYSTVDLPADIPRELLQHLQKVRVMQHPLGIARMSDGEAPLRVKPRKPRADKPAAETRKSKPASKPRLKKPRAD
jgi:ATP-dependent RNA helicase DeaD